MNRLVERARAFAEQAHAGQVDKAGAPYIGHPARVARRVIELGGSPAQVAAAWLHDVVEDCGVSEQQLAQEFPARVVRLVVALTKVPGQSRQAYYQQVLAVEGAVLVKGADIDDNTDPERVARLEPAVRERLAAKYAEARGALGLVA